MPFQWVGYLEIARELASRTDEPALRTAASRAYYAAFGTARERLEAEGESLTGGSDICVRVWERYLFGDDGPRHYIGVDGNCLRRERNRADYDPSVAFDQVTALKAIRLATTIIGALGRLGEPHEADTEK